MRFTQASAATAAERFLRNSLLELARQAQHTCGPHLQIVKRASLSMSTPNVACRPTAFHRCSAEVRTAAVVSKVCDGEEQLSIVTRYYWIHLDTVALEAMLALLLFSPGFFDAMLNLQLETSPDVAALVLIASFYFRDLLNPTPILAGVSRPLWDGPEQLETCLRRRKHSHQEQPRRSCD